MEVGVARGEIQIETGQAINSIQSLSAALQGMGGQSLGAMQQQGIQIQQMGLAYQQAGRVALGVGTAFAAPLVGAAKAAIDFESQMAGVNAVMDLQAGQYEELSHLASQLGADTIFSGTEAARGIETLGKAGISYQDIMGGAAEATTDLAAAAEISTEMAADTIAAGIQAFGLTGDEAVNVADAIAGAANSSLASASDLAMGLGNVGSTANQLGMDIYDTAAALAVLTDRGQSGTDAATTLRTALQFLVAPSKTMAAEQEALGLSVYDAQGNFKGLEEIARDLVDTYDELGYSQGEQLESMKRLVGQDGMRALVGMTEAVRKENSDTAKGIDDYNEAVREQGAAQRFAQERMDSTAGAIERLMGSISVLAENFGAPMLAAIRPVVEAADVFVDLLARIPQPIMAVIAAVTSAAAALTLFGGAALFAGGHIVEAIGRLTSVGINVGAIAANFVPLLRIITLIAAAISGLALAWNTDFLGVRTTVQGLIADIQSAWEQFGRLSAPLNLGGVTDTIYQIGLALDSLIGTGAGEFFRDLAVGVDAFWDTYNKKVKEAETPEGKVEGFGNAMIDPAVEGQINKQVDLLQHLNFIAQAAAKGIDEFLGTNNKISPILRRASRAAVAYGEAYEESIAEGASGAEAALNGLAAAADKMQLDGLANFFTNASQAVGGFLTSMQGMIDTGMNPMAAAIIAGGQAIEFWTGLPVGEIATTWGRGLNTLLTTFEDLTENGVDPLSAGLLSISEAARTLGFQGVANAFFQAARAVSAFQTASEEAIQQGLNPFDAAIQGVASALDVVFGPDNALSTGIRNFSGLVRELAGDIGPRLSEFGSNIREYFEFFNANGMGVVESAIRGFGAALGELLGIDISGALTGFGNFFATIGQIRDALFAGDWSGAAAGIQSAIDQVKGAVEGLNIEQVAVNIGSWALGNIVQPIGDFLQGLFGGGQIDAGSASADPRFGGAVSGAAGAGITVHGILVNIGSWAMDKIGEAIELAKQEIVSWATGALATIGGAIEAIPVGEVKAAVEGWIVDLATGAKSLFAAVQEWALGGGSNSMGGPGERGEAGTNVGAIETFVGNVKALVEGWVVSLASGAQSLFQAVSDWATGAGGAGNGSTPSSGAELRGEGAGAIEALVGKVKALVEGWLPELADTAIDIATAIKDWATPLVKGAAENVEVLAGKAKALVEGWTVELASTAVSLGQAVQDWAMGSGGGSNSMLGPGGELTGPDGRGGSGSSGALVEIASVSAEILGWVITGGANLAQEVLNHALDLLKVINEIPLGEIDAVIDSFLVTARETITDAISRFLAGQGLGTGGDAGGSTPMSGGELRGGAAQATIPQVLIEIGKIAIKLADAALDLVGSVTKFLDDLILGANFTEADLQNAEVLGERAGAAIAKAVENALGTEEFQGQILQAAENAGANFSMVDLINRFLRGAQRSMGSPTFEFGFENGLPTLRAIDVDDSAREQLEDAAYEAARDLANDVSLRDKPDIFLNELPGVSLSDLAVAGFNTDLQQSLQEQFPGQDVQIQPDGTITVDGQNLDLSTIDFPDNIETGVPLGVSPKGLVIDPATGQSVEMGPAALTQLAEGIKSGQIIVNPEGIFVDPAGQPIRWTGEGMSTPLEAGQPLTLTPNRGIVVDAAGNLVQLSPETQRILDDGWDRVFFGSTGETIKVKMPDGTLVDVQFPPEAFGPVAEQTSQSVQDAIRAHGWEPTGDAMMDQIGLAIMEAGQDPNALALSGGLGIGQQFERIVTDEVTQTPFEGLKTALGTKLGQVFQAGLDLLKGQGQETGGAGSSMGQQVADSLSQEIGQADFSTVQQALKIKIGQALQEGLSGGGEGAGGEAGAAASTIGGAIVSSLVSALSGADFTMLGGILSAKISEALTQGLSAAGGQAGGAGAAGGAGGGIGASIAKSVVDGVSGADFSAVGEAVATAIGSSMGGATQGLQSALDAVMGAVVAAGQNSAQQASQIGTALVTAIGSGMGGATGTVQSALGAVISAVVASGNGLAASSSPPIGTALVTGAASGVGPATGTFQSAITAMVTAGVASGVADATSQSPQIGTALASNAGQGIGASTGTFQEAIGAMVSAGVAHGVGVAEAEAPAIGAALSTGAAAGVIVNALDAKIAEMVRSGIAAGMAEAGAQSPAREMMPLGQYMAEGAAVGVEENSDKLADRIRDMVDGAISGLGNLSELGDQIRKAVSDAMDAGKELQGLGGDVGAGAGLGDLGQEISSIGEDVEDNSRGIRETVKDMIDSITAEMRDMEGEAKEAGKSLGQEMASGVSEGATEALGQTKRELQKEVNDTIQGLDLRSLKVDRSIFQEAKQGFIDIKALKQNADELEDLGRSLSGVPGFEDLAAELYEQADQIRDSANEGKDHFKTIMGDMKDLIKEQGKEIKDIIKELRTTLMEAARASGEAVGEGTAAGIDSSSEAPGQSAMELAEKLGVTIGAGVTSIGAHTEKLLGGVVGEQMPAAIEEATPALEQAGTDVGTDLANAVDSGLETGTQEALPGATEAGTDIGTSFTNGVASTIPTAQELGSQISTSVLESLQASSIADSEAVKIIGEVFGQAFGTGVASASEETTAAGASLVDAAETGLNQGTGQVEKTGEAVGSNIGSSLSDGLADACKPVNDQARDLSSECAPSGIENGTKAGERAGEKAGESIGEAVADGMDSTENDLEKVGTKLGHTSVDEMIQAIKSKENGLQTQVKNTINSAENVEVSTKSVGEDFIEGMKTGLTNKEGSLYTKVKEIVRAAIKAAKNEADSASPSKKMMEIGEWMGQGLTIGLENESQGPVDAMVAMTNAVLDAANMGDIQIGAARFETPTTSEIQRSMAYLDQFMARKAAQRFNQRNPFMVDTRGTTTNNISGDTIIIEGIEVHEGDSGYEEVRGLVDALGRGTTQYSRRGGW